MNKINHTLPKSSDQQGKSQSAFHGPCVVLEIKIGTYLMMFSDKDAGQIIKNIFAVASGGDATSKLKGMPEKVFNDLLQFARVKDDHYAETGEKRKMAADARWSKGRGDDANAFQMDGNENQNENTNQIENQNENKRESVSKLDRNDSRSDQDDMTPHTKEGLKKLAEDLGLGDACDENFLIDFYTTVVMNDWTDVKGEEIERPATYFKNAILKHIGTRLDDLYHEDDKMLKQFKDSPELPKRRVPAAREYVRLAPLWLKFNPTNEKRYSDALRHNIDLFQRIIDQWEKQEKGK